MVGKLLGRWKTGIVLATVLFIAYSSYLGIAEEFFWWTLTTYGGFVIARTVIQLVLARRNNKEVRDANRSYIFTAFSNVISPTVEAIFRNLTKRPMRFDDFRNVILGWLAEQYMADGKDEEEAKQEALRLWYVMSAESMRILGEKYRDKPIGGIPLEKRQTRDIPVSGLTIPMYKTPIDQLESLLQSAEAQTTPYKGIIVVINEHNDALAAEVQRLISQIAEDPSKYAVFQEPRKGKRNAMERGMRWLFELGVDYVMNSDSDSKLDIDANSNFLRVAVEFGAGCATGDVRVWNDNDNWLAKLTAHRYQQAFNIERAAQSLFGGVTCMSGPLLGVESILLQSFIDQWVEQYYLGMLCNFGDDRNISTNVLRLGRSSYYNPECIVLTDCPTDIWVWRKQQTRWSRSANRETIISLPFMHRLPIWVQFDMAYQFLFPFILLGILLSLIFRTVSIGVAYGADDAFVSLLPYATIVIGLNLLFKAAYGYLSYKDKWYISTPLYIILHYFILLPIRLWALITPKNNEWGTK